MLNVSNAYKLAVADSHRISRMRAVIKTEENTYHIADDDIIKDTVYVTNQCTNGNDYEYGCVYSAECGLSIRSSIDRYTLYNAEISLFWSLYTSEGWVEIPLGVFIITEPTRINDKIKIKALDRMTLLDKNIDADTQGNFATLLNYVAEKCGITIANTSEDLTSFINSDFLFSVYSDSVETYRDLVAYLGMITASFCTFDRLGRLKMVKYSTSTDLILSKKQRFMGASFSDYITKFSQVKARFIANENYAPYESISETDGLILDLGDIPIVRGLPEVKKQILNNIYEVAKLVNYTPFELQTMSNPAIELGDMIENAGVGKNNLTYVAPITYFSWNYRGKQKLKSVGGNPKLLSVTSKANKQMNSMQSSIDSKAVVVKKYRNADVITFTGNAVEIAKLNFSVSENSNPILLTNTRLTTDRDGVLCLKICMDGVADEKKVYRKYLERGVHFVTLSEVFEIENNKRHTVSVMASMEYFESDNRKQNADIQTHKNFLNALSTLSTTVVDNVVQFPTYEIASIDTSVAGFTIEIEESLAILFGQGMGTEEAWDGTINISDDVLMSFGSAFNMNVADTMNIGLQNPKLVPLSEIVNMRLGGALNFDGFNEFIHIGDILKNYIFNVENSNEYIIDEYISTKNDIFTLKNIFTYESREEIIDAGALSKVNIDYTNINVESVVVSNG